MLDGNSEERRTLSESYTSAVSLGNSRVQAHRLTPADLIVAAGMNRNRMGIALMRLASEWNSGAVPKPVDAPDVKALAREIAKHRVEEEIRSQDTGNGLAQSKKREMRAAVTITKADLEQAHRELNDLQAQSVDWNLEENKLRFQRLKTLTWVRSGLVYWAHEREWEEAEHIVASVLRYFLSPNCPACNGSGLQMVPGTLGRDAKRVCKECRDNKLRGKRNVPHGGRGRKLLDHLQACIGTAVRDLREGTYRTRRDDLSEHERQEQREEEQAIALRRAGAEARRDAKSDPAKIAAIAARTMGTRSVVDRLLRQIGDYRDAHDKQAPAQLQVTRDDLIELMHDRRAKKYGCFVNLVMDPPTGGFMGVALVCGENLP
jgi:hypothetical protein